MGKATSPQRQYWDSCVFLSYIGGPDDRALIIEELMGQCDRGEIEVYTSQLTIAEVAFSGEEKENRRLKSEELQRIDLLWQPPSSIKLVELHEVIAYRARDLRREILLSGIKGLRANDAIHLATAQRVDADVFCTYDNGLMKASAIAKLEIGVPSLQDPHLFLKPND